MEIIPANAICLECGTSQQRSEDGFCINGHDNWLEQEDSAERFAEAIVKFKKPLVTIILSIQNNTDLCQT